MKKTLLTTLALLVSSGLFAVSAHAQAKALTQKQIADLAVKHSDAMIANRKTLETYSSNYRVEVSKNAQIQWINLVNVKIGADLNPIITQVNHDQIVAPAKGIFSKGNQTKEFEKMDEITAYTIKWITYYNRLPAPRIFTLFSQAAQNGTYKVAPYSANVIGVWSTNIRNTNANDQVTLWFNKENGHPIKYAFVIPTQLGPDGGATGETISATINYRYMQNGEAFYPDHIDVSIPSQEMTIKVEHLVTVKSQ